MRSGKDQRASGTPPEGGNFDGFGRVHMTRLVMRSYYYGVGIPQDVDSDATIGLFEGHIGDRQWTNLTRPGRLPVGHTAMLFKVSLAVKPTEETRILDVFSALQLGDLRITIGSDEFLREPLSFFPVTLYGEIAAREADPLRRLAVSIEVKHGVDDEEQKRLLRRLSGIAIPTMIGYEQLIDGAIDLNSRLYGTPAFVLYVCLHTITVEPIR